MIKSMTDAGLIVEGLNLDNEIHRVDVAGKRPGNKAGWYVAVEIRGNVYGSFGRWDTGQKWKHKDCDLVLTDDDVAMIKLVAERVKAEKLARQQSTAQEAKEMMAMGDIPFGHKYMDAKGIDDPGDVRMIGDMLLVPMSYGGEVVNIQRIWPDGTKKFLAGGMVTGCGMMLGGIGEQICICEGWATGVSINRATGLPVVVAFSAGNLKVVARDARARYPKIGLIICGDNDKSGTGQKAATEAAAICDGVVRLPDQIGDYNDVAGREGEETVRISILEPSRGQIKDFDSITLQIPDELLSVPGLISWGLEGCLKAGAADIIQYNYPVVLAMICRALAGRFEGPGMTWPTMYFVKVGPTSSGKTDIDRIMATAVRNAGLDGFYTTSDFSSGPGLLRCMTEAGRAQALIALDEVTYLFRRYGDNDTLGAGKFATLLELYTAAGQQINRRYGDSKNNIVIDKPCLILTGNATPLVFNDLKVEDTISGTLQRFDFFCYSGKTPYRNMIDMDGNEPMNRFIEGLRELYLAPVPEISGHDLSALGAVNRIFPSGDCQEMLTDYSHRITDRINELPFDQQFSRGVISRQYSSAIKMAMVHMASVRGIDEMFRPMGVEDLAFGIKLAGLLCQWKIDVLSDKIVSGKHDKWCAIFRDAVIAASKMKKKPTGKLLTNRRPVLRELKPKEWDDVVTSLKAQEIIEVREGGQHTLYYPGPELYCGTENR